ncbi:MAG: hypothetical protein LBR08_03550 [Bacteroidales bacterium]|nr:hypothetical protein [Bacteroidales bacterium]
MCVRTAPWQTFACSESLSGVSGQTFACSESLFGVSGLIFALNKSLFGVSGLIFVPDGFPVFSVPPPPQA